MGLVLWGIRRLGAPCCCCIQVPAWEKFSKYVTSLYFQQPLPEPNTCHGLFSLWLLGSFLARVSWELYLLNELDFSQTNKKYRNNISHYCYVKHIYYSSNTDTRRIYVPLLCTDGHLNNMGREVGLKGRMVGGTMRCPYKWLMCPPPNHALIHTTNSGSPAKFWFGILQNMSPWYLTVNINFQVNIFSFLTDLITKGEMPRHKMFPLPTEPKIACESDFEMLSWTLMQWSSVCIGNALPSDMRTIRGSQAFKVSITILTHASSSKWSFSSEQVIEHEIWAEKEISASKEEVDAGEKATF